MEFLSGVESADKRVKVLKNETRLGVAGSRNRAIEESSGDYIAIIDGDDYCAPDRFEKQLSFLANNPDISVVGSNMYLIDESGNITGERKYPELHEDIKRRFLLTMAIANPSVILRRKDIAEAGLLKINFIRLKILSCGSDFWLIIKKCITCRKIWSITELRIIAIKREGLCILKMFISQERDIANGYGRCTSDLQACFSSF